MAKHFKYNNSTIKDMINKESDETNEVSEEMPVEESIIEEESTDKEENEVIEESVVETIEEVKDIKTVIVTANKLNIRSSKDANIDNVIGILCAGDKVVGEKDGDWFKLSTGGYVMSKFVV